MSTRDAALWLNGNLMALVQIYNPKVLSLSCHLIYLFPFLKAVLCSLTRYRQVKRLILFWSVNHSFLFKNSSSVKARVFAKGFVVTSLPVSPEKFYFLTNLKLIVGIWCLLQIKGQHVLYNSSLFNSAKDLCDICLRKCIIMKHSFYIQ